MVRFFVAILAVVLLLLGGCACAGACKVSLGAESPGAQASADCERGE